MVAPIALPTSPKGSPPGTAAPWQAASRSQDAVLREPSAQSTEASAALSSKAAGPSRRAVFFFLDRK